MAMHSRIVHWILLENRWNELSLVDFTVVGPMRRCQLAALKVFQNQSTFWVRQLGTHNHIYYNILSILKAPAITLESTPATRLVMCSQESLPAKLAFQNGNTAYRTRSASKADAC